MENKYESDSEDTLLEKNDCQNCAHYHHRQKSRRTRSLFLYGISSLLTSVLLSLVWISTPLGQHAADFVQTHLYGKQYSLNRNLGTL